MGRPTSDSFREASLDPPLGVAVQWQMLAYILLKSILLYEHGYFRSAKSHS
jgi:hypothetical protein